MKCSKVFKPCSFVFAFLMLLLSFSMPIHILATTNATTASSEQPIPLVWMPPMFSQNLTAIQDITDWNRVNVMTTIGARIQNWPKVTVDSKSVDAEVLVLNVRNDISVSGNNTTIKIPQGRTVLLQTHPAVLSSQGRTTITMHNEIRHFIVEGGGTLIVQNIILSGGDHKKIGGGIDVVSSADGNRGNLYLMGNGMITQSRSADVIDHQYKNFVGGGGIFVNNANLTIIGGMVEENSSASSGGGVCAINNSQVRIARGSIQRNEAVTHSQPDQQYIELFIGYGGGLFVDYSTFEMYGGVIKNNTAVYGGGVAAFGTPHDILEFSNNQKQRIVPTCTMRGGVIANNHAQKDGGGIYAGDYVVFNTGAGQDASVRFYVDQNTADQHGGGIYAREEAGLLIDHANIINNVAGTQDVGYGGGIFIASYEYEEPVLNDNSYQGHTFRTQFTENIVFHGNKAASGAFHPPENADTFGNKRIPVSQQTSISWHPLNNYDINFMHRYRIDIERQRAGVRIGTCQMYFLSQRNQGALDAQTVQYGDTFIFVVNVVAYLDNENDIAKDVEVTVDWDYNLKDLHILSRGHNVVQVDDKLIFTVGDLKHKEETRIVFSANALYQGDQSLLKKVHVPIAKSGTAMNPIPNERIPLNGFFTLYDRISGEKDQNKVMVHDVFEFVIDVGDGSGEYLKNYDTEVYLKWYTFMDDPVMQSPHSYRREGDFIVFDMGDMYESDMDRIVFHASAKKSALQDELLMELSSASTGK